jgi:hypothetical protein
MRGEQRPDLGCKLGILRCDRVEYFRLLALRLVDKFKE